MTCRRTNEPMRDVFASILALVEAKTELCGRLLDALNPDGPPTRHGWAGTSAGNMVTKMTTPVAARKSAA